MAFQNTPVVKTQMLIRKPVSEVFAAFIDPSITTRFWFTRSSGRLVPGMDVRWDWEMYGVSTQVMVKEVEENHRILIEWDDPPCPVEWQFEPQGEQATLVRIFNWGFRGSEDDVLAQALDAMGGFTMVLAGLKAFLEYGLELNLIADIRPEANVGGGR